MFGKAKRFDDKVSFGASKGLVSPAFTLRTASRAFRRLPLAERVRSRSLNLMKKGPTPKFGDVCRDLTGTFTQTDESFSPYFKDPNEMSFS